MDPIRSKAFMDIYFIKLCAMALKRIVEILASWAFQLTLIIKRIFDTELNTFNLFNTFPLFEIN